MNGKKVKQLRKVVRSLTKQKDNTYITKKNGTITLDKLSPKSLLKELKKSFK